MRRVRAARRRDDVDTAVGDDGLRTFFRWEKEVELLRQPLVRQTLSFTIARGGCMSPAAGLHPSDWGYPLAGEAVKGTCWRLGSERGGQADKIDRSKLLSTARSITVPASTDGTVSVRVTV